MQFDFETEMMNLEAMLNTVVHAVRGLETLEPAAAGAVAVTVENAVQRLNILEGIILSTTTADRINEVARSAKRDNAGGGA